MVQVTQSRIVAFQVCAALMVTLIWLPLLGGPLLASATCYDTDGTTVVSGCNCFSTCATCGNAPVPTGEKDCKTCVAGKTLFPYYTDGTGFCLTATTFSAGDYKIRNPTSGRTLYAAMGTFNTADWAAEFGAAKSAPNGDADQTWTLSSPGAGQTIMTNKASNRRPYAQNTYQGTTNVAEMAMGIGAARTSHGSLDQTWYFVPFVNYGTSVETFSGTTTGNYWIFNANGNPLSRARRLGVDAAKDFDQGIVATDTPILSANPITSFEWQVTQVGGGTSGQSGYVGRATGMHSFLSGATAFCFLSMSGLI